MKHVIVLNAGTDRLTGEPRMLAVGREVNSQGLHICKLVTSVQSFESAVEQFPDTPVVRGLAVDGTFIISVRDYNAYLDNPELLHQHWSSSGVSEEITVL